MSTFENNMEKIFDLSPIDKSVKNLPVLPEKTIALNEFDLDSDLVDAYKQTKDNLQDLIENGKEAMEQLLEISSESQSPRAYEVYATLLRNLVDANKELLSIQKQMRDIDNKIENNNSTTNIDKAIIFNGSTAELGKFLKNVIVDE